MIEKSSSESVPRHSDEPRPVQGPNGEGFLATPAVTPEQNAAAPPPRRRRFRLLWLLLLVALAIAFYFFFFSRIPRPGAQGGPGAGAGAAQRGRRGPGAIPVVATRATRGNIGVYLNGLGTVTPLNTVTVKSRVDGQLMEVLYREGDIVQKGALLVQIDPRPYEVQAEQAEGQLLRDQALLANARTDLARYQTLLTQNAIPEQQVATQKSLVTQDEGLVRADQAQLDNARLNLTYSRITAPITGRVGLRLVDPGNIVRASDANGLVVITQLEPITVIFTISEDQLPLVLPRMRSGQALRVDAYDRDMANRIAQGRLTTIDNQIDPATGTVRLRATFDNRDNRLFPNEFVNARLLVQEKRNVVLLNSAAIQRSSAQTYVYLVKPDNTVTVRTITVGTNEGQNSEIVSGLQPGETVVMTGVDKLREGAKVNAQIPGEDGGRPGGESP